MDKRFIAALLLSTIVLIGWQIIEMRFFPKPPPPSAEPAAAESAPPPATKLPASTRAIPVVETVPERSFAVHTSRWSARFSNRGAIPVSWSLQRGPDGRAMLAADGGPLELIPQQHLDQTEAPLSLWLPGDAEAARRLATANWRVEGVGDDNLVTIADGDTVEFSFSTTDPATGLSFVKRFSATGGEWDVDLTIDDGGARVPIELALGPRFGDQSIKTEGSYTNTPPTLVVSQGPGSCTYVTAGEVTENAQTVNGLVVSSKLLPGAAQWCGIEDNYFAMVMLGKQRPTQVTAVKYAKAEQLEHDYLLVRAPVQPGEQVHIFVGPKDRRLLIEESAAYSKALGQPVDLEGLVNYGFFAFLVRPLIPIIDDVLQFTNRITNNYGWSIIIITVLFNLLFLPLKYKSSVSMRRAAKLQPRMKELQEKMKRFKPADPQYRELQMEQMALMKEGNPLGGCLPLLIQMPFFWAFFVYFTTSFDVRHTPWLGWVTDLSAPDPYYILPVLMCGAQIGSTMITPMPASDDPAMRFQRTLMTWVLPVVFTYFFLVAAPSGLVLYWMTLNLVGIGSQFLINRIMPQEQEAAAQASVAKDKAKARA